MKIRPAACPVLLLVLVGQAVRGRTPAELGSVVSAIDDQYLRTTSKEWQQGRKALLAGSQAIAAISRRIAQAKIPTCDSFPPSK
jgi:hypothetical protein